LTTAALRTGSLPSLASKPSFRRQQVARKALQSAAVDLSRKAGITAR